MSRPAVWEVVSIVWPTGAGAIDLRKPADVTKVEAVLKAMPLK